jgi:thiol:disulfide interchange protein DsbD
MMRFIKKLFLVLMLLSGISIVVYSQSDLVSWKIASDAVGDKTFDIKIMASIAPGWHMYDMGPYENGPNATTFTFTLPNGVTKVGEISSIEKPVKVNDPMFGMVIGYYEKSVTFVQKVKLAVPKATVEVMVEWMTCDDTSCTPPDDHTMKIELQAPFLASEVQDAAARETPGLTQEESDEVTADSSPDDEVQMSAPEKATRGGSLWAMIIEAILWGFAALLTPCVFPMVPMTVSFFIKGSEDKVRGRFRAIMYGLFIVLLYTVPIAAIIIITRLVGGDAVTADIFNWLATHWLPNILFFLVFMVFAASFFGAFEIVMPSKLVNKSDQQATKRQGLGGVFFLALTLVLVSFSCTGPIVGTVLIKSTAGEFWAPIITMLAFSFAFALPFMIFALFPSLLGNVPKSGGWLNSVKVVLGFIEVALGFKFLSVADQVYHWGLLDREVYLAIWIVCFTLLGFYLLGKLKFKHDSDLQHIGVFRLVLAIASFSFVVYMIPGMWGAPLKGLSGYLPPISTQDFVIPTDGSSTTQTEAASTYTVKYGDFLKLPHGLNGFFDLEEAQAYAARVGKPVFVDFTGHGCVNCREMEARVWSDPRVLEILKRDFVICALYADDKKQVPEENWVTNDNGKVLKTLGKINSHFALTRYGVNAQPYYVLEDNNGRQLVEPRGYNLDVESFIQWLEEGVKAYKSREQL